MSARDDFPPIPHGVNVPGGWGALHLRMCAEIDRLRAWKIEAIDVLAMWDQCYDELDQAGHAARLGEIKPYHVLRWIETAIDQLRSSAAEQEQLVGDMVDLVAERARVIDERDRLRDRLRNLLHWVFPGEVILPIDMDTP
jgi:uncharacterized coiled-coil protein SlyX